MKKFLVIFLLLITSCITPRGDISTSYPPDIKAMCDKVSAEAMQCIIDNGTSLKLRSSVRVEKINGVKKVNGVWCWKVPQYYGEQWIAGLTFRSGRTYIIQTGCNPVNKAEVRDIFLKHEFGHYWLMSNYGDSANHSPQFKKCFINWNDTPTIKTLHIKDGGVEMIANVIEEK